ncbi:MAG TPA: Hsp33 family molecular chaperone HslO [Polyangiaceae bacterium]|nr:Hsp33 family molecular chaperone HslO [Polyangiaceae bacterium]
MTSPTPDTVLRAFTDDYAFRVVAARTTALVRRAIESQRAEGETARTFADLLTGTVLVRETMAPQLRVQGILRDARGKGRLVADAHPDGGTRGLVQSASPGGALDLGAGSMLEMTRTLPNGASHQGVVELPPEGGVSGALMAYMQQSEQIVSVVDVGTVLRGDDLLAAGGFIVQLLPEARGSAIERMADRLEGVRATTGLFAGDRGLLDLVGDLLGQPVIGLDERPLAFACRCDELRLMAALATLPREDLEALVNEQNVIETSCDFCGKEFRLAPEKLRGLLSPS